MNLLNNTKAVSPVIGVMLMVVVTIILAAVVSGFASDVGGAETKGAQLSIQVDSSDGNWIAITHMGGDSMSGSLIQIQTVRTAQAGGSAGVVHEVGMANVTFNNASASGTKLVGTYSSELWTAGDTLYVPWDDAWRFGFYSLMAPEVGETFQVVIIDKSTGKPAASCTATLKS
ncbi:MAG: type IV pilin N-terminal domain-containing protein [Methermicoccaceae archaeon]